MTKFVLYPPASSSIGNCTAIRQNIIHKAKLKREYAKILKREGIEDPRTQHDDEVSENEDTAGEVHALPTRAPTSSEESRKHESEKTPGEPEDSDATNVRLPKHHREARHARKGKRPNHRPDPFREAKVRPWKDSFPSESVQD